MTQQQLDEARAAVSSHADVTLSCLQVTCRLSYDQVVTIAEALEAEGHLGPQWREREKRAALQQYAAAIRALGAIEAGKRVDGCSGAGDAREVAYAWRRTATRVGATEAELQQAREDSN
jgi:hypothetical protein